MKYILIILILIAGTLNAGTWRINAKAAATPADDDVFLLEDQNDTWASKKVTATALAAYIAAEIQGTAMTLTAVTIDNDAGTNAISNIRNADINAAADIDWSKMDDDAFAGNFMVATDASGDMSETTVSDSDILVILPTNDEAVFDGGAYVQLRAAAGNQLKVTDGVLLPNTDNDIDLGAVGTEFKNGFFDGTVTTDGLIVDGTVNIDGGAVVFNEDSGDYDFRVETNGAADAFDIDAGKEMINIGTGFGFGQGVASTFADVDATPSVLGSSIWYSGTAVEEITNFDNGGQGQILIVYSQEAITFDADAGNLIPPDGVDLVTDRFDMTVWIYLGVTWMCLSYSDNH